MISKSRHTDVLEVAVADKNLTLTNRTKKVTVMVKDRKFLEDIYNGEYRRVMETWVEGRCEIEKYLKRHINPRKFVVLV